MTHRDLNPPTANTASPTPMPAPHSAPLHLHTQTKAERLARPRMLVVSHLGHLKTGRMLSHQIPFPSNHIMRARGLGACGCVSSGTLGVSWRVSLLFRNLDKTVLESWGTIKDVITVENQHQQPQGLLAGIIHGTWQAREACM